MVSTLVSNIKVFARKRFVSKFKTRQVADTYAGVTIIPDQQDDLCNFATEDSIKYRATGKAWRGSRKKDPSFIQCFVDSLTDDSGVVFDWSASTVPSDGYKSDTPTFKKPRLQIVSQARRNC